jgi:hypothetical protein
MGFTLAYEAEVANGARVGYFDTHGMPPAMFDGFRAAARDWDGSDPVRLRI